jgi:2-polyprenyl-3-methyl-5-hydroxy-6-metoxy-1,4-benzoquinol methylase
MQELVPGRSAHSIIHHDDEGTHSQMSYALESVRSQYEKYPYPAYSEDEVKVAAKWLSRFELSADTVVDVGCGTGLWSIAFALNGSKVTAVDFSKASLLNASKMAHTFGVSISFYHSDLFGFHTSNRFGLVFCNGVLHHTGNAQNGFHRISEFVDDDGLLVTSLYNRLSPFRLAKWLVRGLGGRSVDTRRHVAQAVIDVPLVTTSLDLLGRSQGGPLSSVQDYLSRQENIVDLLCHAHTSYHSLWEIENWYLAEGFVSFATIPSGSIASAILPNLIFYIGRRPRVPSP